MERLKQTDEKGYNYVVEMKRLKDGSVVFTQEDDLESNTYLYLYPSQIKELIKILKGFHSSSFEDKEIKGESSSSPFVEMELYPSDSEKEKIFKDHVVGSRE